ncbi:MAG: hypothetical protein H6721_07035 [Sandaracinus sp.]|nr:hypothetical protein [Sandaracinus sp.]
MPSVWLVVVAQLLREGFDARSSASASSSASRRKSRLDFFFVVDQQLGRRRTWKLFDPAKPPGKGSGGAVNFFRASEGSAPRGAAAGAAGLLGSRGRATDRSDVSGKSEVFSTSESLARRQL